MEYDIKIGLQILRLHIGTIYRDTVSTSKGLNKYPLTTKKEKRQRKNRRRAELNYSQYNEGIDSLDNTFLSTRRQRSVVPKGRYLISAYKILTKSFI